jgi:hypothetical protein
MERRTERDAEDPNHRSVVLRLIVDDGAEAGDDFVEGLRWKKEVRKGRNEMTRRNDAPEGFLKAC